MIKRFLLLCMLLLLPINVSAQLWGHPSRYITSVSLDNVATGSDSTITPLDIRTDTVRVVKIWGGMLADELSTSSDYKIYSARESDGTVNQENLIYVVNNVTTGYLIDDVPVYLTSTGTTDDEVYLVIHNDGAESDYEFNLEYLPHRLIE